MPIAALAAWAYAPALHGTWLWDDAVSISDNPLLRTAGGLRDLWLGRGTPDYFPLSGTVAWLEWHAFGQRTEGYHIVSFALHGFAALGLTALLRRLGVRSAWIGGALFALHPLAVESVAWISELKNVLSACLLFPAALAYFAIHDPRRRKGVETRPPPPSPNQISNAGVAEARPLPPPSNQFVQASVAETRPSPPSPNQISNDGVAEARPPPPPSNQIVNAGVGGARSPSALGPTAFWPELPYPLSLLLFLASALAKSSVVTAPCALLLLTWWQTGRLAKRDLTKIAPFFAISLAVGLATVFLQHHRDMEEGVLPLAGPLSRIAVAGLAASFYLGKFLAPVGLSPVYSRWAVDPPQAWQLLPAALILALLACAWLRRSTWGRHVFAGAACYLVMLLPVAGFVPAAYFHISWVADHFAYLPLAVLSALAAAAADRWLPRAKRVAHVVPNPLDRLGPPEGGLQPATAAAALIAIVALALATHTYAAVFRDEEALWLRAEAIAPGSWTVDNNLGKVLLKQGRPEEALARLRDARREAPRYAWPEIDLHLGMALGFTGQPFQGISILEEAVALKPNFAGARNNLGLLLSRSGQKDEAIAQFESAAKDDPTDPEIWNNLGTVLTDAGRLPEAVRRFEEALRLDPDYDDARRNLGAALGREGRFAEAEVELRRVLAKQPGRADAHNDLGIVLVRTGRLIEAEAEFQRAVMLDPKLRQAEQNLARVRRDLRR